MTACLPVTVPGGGGGPACPQGTYHVTDQVLDPLVSPIGPLNVDALPGGTLTLAINASTWTLGGSQALAVSGNSPWGPIEGTATVTLDASGSWSTVSSTSLSFSLSSISGSVSFSGTAGGNPVNQTFTLNDVDLDERYGLSGTADYACGSAPDLTLAFTDIDLDLDR